MTATTATSGDGDLAMLEQIAALLHDGDLTTTISDLPGGPLIDVAKLEPTAEIRVRYEFGGAEAAPHAMPNLTLNGRRWRDVPQVLGVSPDTPAAEVRKAMV